MSTQHQIRRLKDEFAVAFKVATDVSAAEDSPVGRLRASLWASGVFFLTVVGLAGLVLFALGKVGPSLPLDLGKCFSLAGAFFAGWGAWMGLLIGTTDNTWKGRELHESARSGFFKLFFLIGAFFATLGSLWWQ